MNKPAISFCMTTYNREKYVGEAIESVLNSSFKDFELIIVDDRSTDRTIDIVQYWVGRDSRVKLFINEKNLGDYPNRNQAASHASGKYLKYVDADDLIYPWGLQVLWECMERFPEAGWGLCSLDQNRVKKFPFVLDTAGAYRYHYLEQGLFHKAPLSSIIKRELFNDLGGFKPGRMVGDSEMWHRLALNSKVVLMPHGMVWYRAHDAQESNVIGEFEDVYRKISLSYLLSDGQPLSRSEQEEVARIQRKKHIREAAVNLLRGNVNRALKSCRKAQASKELCRS